MELILANLDNFVTQGTRTTVDGGKMTISAIFVPNIETMCQLFDPSSSCTIVARTTV